jgi:hypothetical protein
MNATPIITPVNVAPPRERAPSTISPKLAPSISPAASALE